MIGLQKIVNDFIKQSKLINSIINHMGIVLITFDKNGCIQSFNNESESLTGYVKDELSGTSSITDILNPAGRIETGHTEGPEKESISLFQYLICETELGKLREFEFINKHRETRYVAITISKLKAPDNTYLYILTATDISAQKKIEKNLRDNIEEEKELNELKSKFLSTASHEFRTPLATMLIATDSILAHWNEMRSEQVREKITRINYQILHLTNIVNDVLHISKIEQSQVTKKKFDLTLLLTRILDSFYNEEHHYTQLILINPFAKLIIFTDERLFIDIINNLISNAIKFSSKHPKVRIKVFLKPGKLCLSVSDNGRGIPDHDKKFIFSPFFRASNAHEEKGSGLGLSIVKESVEKIGGNISFESDAGRGTTFTVTLPEELIIKKIKPNEEGSVD